MCDCLADLSISVHCSRTAMTPRDVQQLALVACHDGQTSSLTRTIASCGTSGRNSQNTERDLHRGVQRIYGNKPDIYYAYVMFLNPNIGGVEIKQFGMFLPHELMWALHTHFPSKFHTAFLSSDLSQYWRNMHTEEWFALHPGRTHVLDSPSTAIPLRIHGDDVNVNNNVSGLCFSLASAVGWDQATQDRCPVYALARRTLASTPNARACTLRNILVNTSSRVRLARPLHFAPSSAPTQSCHLPLHCFTALAPQHAGPHALNACTQPPGFRLPDILPLAPLPHRPDAADHLQGHCLEFRSSSAWGIPS